MRNMAVLLAVVCPLTAAEDAAGIIRRSIELADVNFRAARNYTFLERVNALALDGKGREKERKIRTYDITLLEGSPYRRLIARDDKPLSPKDQQKEEERLRKITEQRRKETPEERARRVAEWERKRQRQMEPLRELPEAFVFRLLGEESLDGRELYVIEGKPRPGYQPRSKGARYFPKLQGKIWVDKETYNWVKTEAEVIDTISYGLFLARLAKGAHLSFEQARVNNEVWLPKRVHAEASARLALLRKLQAEVEITYSNYRKFQSDSRIVSVEPLP